MPGVDLAASLAPWVVPFSEAFTAPSFRTFQHLLLGWVLCTGRHTVTGVLRAAGAVGIKHDTSFHRFFRCARWSPDAVGLVLLRIVQPLLPKHEAVVVPLDDTLSRHTGKHIHGASMHHDPLLSTRTQARFHFGHVWVVLSVIIQVPRWDAAFALPVLCRLYRSKKVCEREEQDFFKKTELAAQLLTILASALPNRRFIAVGDAVYTNRAVVQSLPANVDFIGRSRLDAVLYDPPPPHQGRGRPRVKGARVPSPGQRAQSPRGWKRFEVSIYGRTTTLQVKVFDALWYIVGHRRMMRFVLVRGWSGSEYDYVLCSTDLTLDGKAILEVFARRWKLEVTFEEVKGRLGFDEPQCRAEQAVERTAPMALWVYTLTVLWYVQLGHRLPSGWLRQLPWYEKQVPTFSDMLAAFGGGLSVIQFRRTERSTLAPCVPRTSGAIVIHPAVARGRASVGDPAVGVTTAASDSLSADRADRAGRPATQAGGAAAPTPCPRRGRGEGGPGRPRREPLAAIAVSVQRASKPRSSCPQGSSRSKPSSERSSRGYGRTGLCGSDRTCKGVASKAMRSWSMRG